MSQRDYGEKLDLLGVSIQYDIWVGMGWMGGGVTNYLVWEDGGGSKRGIRAWALSPTRRPSHVEVLELTQLDRYLFGADHCWMVLYIFNNLKSLLMSFFRFRAKLLARHASGAQLILPAIYIHPHQLPQYLNVHA